jgi:predicted enzyme related to lactoylglutathione lyase
MHAQDREAAVRALLADGATLVAQQAMPGLRWTVLADPDGNQFCVAQADGA